MTLITALPRHLRPEMIDAVLTVPPGSEGPFAVLGARTDQTEPLRRRRVEAPHSDILR